MYSSRFRIAAVVVATLIALWSSATVVSHWLVAARLRSLTTEPPVDSHWRMTNLQQDSGVLRSSGSFDLAWQIAPGAADRGELVSLGRMEYRVSHVVLPNSLQRFDWSFLPDASASAPMTRAFGVLPAMSGRGTVTPTGIWQTSFDIPAIASVAMAGRVEIAPSQMRIAIGRGRATFDWLVPTMVSHAISGTVALDGVRLTASMPDGKPAHGEFSITADHARAPAGSAEDVRIAAGARVDGNNLTWHARPSARTISANGQTLRDVAIDLEVRV